MDLRIFLMFILALGIGCKNSQTNQESNQLQGQATSLPDTQPSPVPNSCGNFQWTNDYKAVTCPEGFYTYFNISFSLEIIENLRRVGIICDTNTKLCNKCIAPDHVRAPGRKYLRVASEYLGRGYHDAISYVDPREDGPCSTVVAGIGGGQCDNDSASSCQGKSVGDLIDGERRYCFPDYIAISSERSIAAARTCNANSVASVCGSSHSILLCPDNYSRKFNFGVQKAAKCSKEVGRCEKCVGSVAPQNYADPNLSLDRWPMQEAVYQGPTYIVDPVDIAPYCAGNARNFAGCNQHYTSQGELVLCPVGYTTYYNLGVNVLAKCDQNSQLCDRCIGFREAVHPNGSSWSNEVNEVENVYVTDGLVDTACNIKKGIAYCGDGSVDVCAGKRLGTQVDGGYCDYQYEPREYLNATGERKLNQQFHTEKCMVSQSEYAPQSRSVMENCGRLVKDDLCSGRFVGMPFSYGDSSKVCTRRGVFSVEGFYRELCVSSDVN